MKSKHKIQNNVSEDTCLPQAREKTQLHRFCVVSSTCFTPTECHVDLQWECKWSSWTKGLLEGTFYQELMDFDENGTFWSAIGTIRPENGTVKSFQGKFDVGTERFFCVQMIYVVRIDWKIELSQLKWTSTYSCM